MEVAANLSVFSASAVHHGKAAATQPAKGVQMQPLQGVVVTQPVQGAVVTQPLQQGAAQIPPPGQWLTPWINTQQPTCIMAVCCSCVYIAQLHERVVKRNSFQRIVGILIAVRVVGEIVKRSYLGRILASTYVVDLAGQLVSLGEFFVDLAVAFVYMCPSTSWRSASRCARATTSSRRGRPRVRVLHVLLVPRPCFCCARCTRTTTSSGLGQPQCDARRWGRKGTTQEIAVQGELSDLLRDGVMSAIRLWGDSVTVISRGAAARARRKDVLSRIPEHLPRGGGLSRSREDTFESDLHIARPSPPPPSNPRPLRAPPSPRHSPQANAAAMSAKNGPASTASARGRARAQVKVGEPHAPQRRVARRAPVDRAVAVVAHDAPERVVALARAALARARARVGRALQARRDRHGVEHAHAAARPPPRARRAARTRAGRRAPP